MRGAYGQPDSAVRVSRVAGAAGVLLVAEGAHHDRVVERACSVFAVSPPMPFERFPYVQGVV